MNNPCTVFSYYFELLSVFVLFQSIKQSGRSVFMGKMLHSCERFYSEFHTSSYSMNSFQYFRTRSQKRIDCTKNKRPTDGTGCRVSKVIIAQKPRQLPALVLLMRLRSFNTSRVTYRPFKTQFVSHAAGLNIRFQAGFSFP